jgi:hypothetical protein
MANRFGIESKTLLTILALPLAIIFPFWVGYEKLQNSSVNKKLKLHKINPEKICALSTDFRSTTNNLSSLNDAQNQDDFFKASNEKMQKYAVIVIPESHLNVASLGDCAILKQDLSGYNVKFLLADKGLKLALDEVSQDQAIDLCVLSGGSLENKIVINNEHYNADSLARAMRPYISDTAQVVLNADNMDELAEATQIELNGNQQLFAVSNYDTSTGLRLTLDQDGVINEINFDAKNCGEISSL